MRSNKIPMIIKVFLATACMLFVSGITAQQLARDCSIKLSIAGEHKINAVWLTKKNSPPLSLSFSAQAKGTECKVICSGSGCDLFDKNDVISAPQLRYKVAEDLLHCRLDPITNEVVWSVYNIVKDESTGQAFEYDVECLNPKD